MLVPALAQHGARQAQLTGNGNATYEATRYIDDGRLSGPGQVRTAARIFLRPQCGCACPVAPGVDNVMLKICNRNSAIYMQCYQQLLEDASASPNIESYVQKDKKCRPRYRHREAETCKQLFLVVPLLIELVYQSILGVRVSVTAAIVLVKRSVASPAGQESGARRC